MHQYNVYQIGLSKPYPDLKVKNPAARFMIRNFARCPYFDQSLKG